MYQVVWNFMFWLYMSLFNATGNVQYLIDAQQVGPQSCMLLQWDDQGRSQFIIEPMSSCQRP